MDFTIYYVNDFIQFIKKQTKININ